MVFFQMNEPAWFLIRKRRVLAKWKDKFFNSKQLGTNYGQKQHKSHEISDDNHKAVQVG